MDSIYTVRIISTQIRSTDPGVVARGSSKDAVISTVMRHYRKACHHAILQMKAGGLTQFTLLDKYKSPSHVKQDAFSMGRDWSFQQVCNIKCYTSFIKDTLECKE